MTDRERLVELLRKDNCCIDYDCNKCLSNTHCYPKTVADLILADGWIRPPCKVGTHIWVIPTKENGLPEITEMAVRGFSIGEPCDVANCFRIRGTCALYQPSFDMFGQSVLFTREEAEMALRKDEGK